MLKENDKRAELSFTVTIPEIINKVRFLVNSDLQFKVHKTANEVNISTEWIFDIFHYHLNMNKLFTKWVARLLNADQMSALIHAEFPPLN